MKAVTHWVKTQDGQQLFAKTWGEQHKPAVVLVHGYPDNQEVWSLVIEHLSQEFYIVSYDVRGAGQSSIPKRIRDYALPRLSLDLGCVVDQLLPQRAFHLAAHDWGSIQSWESVTEASFKGKIKSFSSISGPCLDHAAFWMRDQFSSNQMNFFNQLTKSWYIAAFQLPLLAPTFWSMMGPAKWSKVLKKLEQCQSLPSNTNIAADGKNGVALYRANFIPRLSRPRQRFAHCPVQAIVLKRDNFVASELIDEMPKWVNDFERVEVNANHWAILSQAESIASYIRNYALKHDG